ncbi:MAG TPA: hypothetical protein VGK74_17580 [Symbiobacteriaceae bacterium]|jgi:hypothetical protein
MQQIAPQPQQFAQPQAFMQSHAYGGQPGPMGGPQGQPMYQQPGPQQSAPVAPVQAPFNPAGMSGGGPQQQQQQQPQNPYARPAISIARTLEQAIPGYQLLVSVVQDLAVTPRGESLAQAAPAVLEIMRELVLQHYAALGAIRRVLCGETTPDVFMALAIPVNQLILLHSQVRPLVDRLSMAAPPELRAPFSGLSQAISGNDMHLSQASQAIQQVFGPQVWEAARSRVYSQPGI